MNDIDKAYDEYKASEDRTIDKDSLYGRQLSERKSFTAGYKQGVSQLSSKIFTEMCRHENQSYKPIIDLIDTELNKENKSDG